MNIEKIVDLNHTISKDFFTNSNVFEVILNLKNYIVKLGKSLDKSNYIEKEENIWISKSAVIDNTVHIDAPCIIDDNAEIRHCAYIRAGVIIGKNCIIGNSCELKNSIIFDNAQIPHFNYVGDSIIGYKSHMGAGVIATNLKSDKSNIIIKDNDTVIKTGLTKMGSIIGNFVEIGCNSTLFPGTIIYPNTTIYPLTRVRGIIPENSIVKNEKEIVKKEEKKWKNYLEQME